MIPTPAIVLGIVNNEHPDGIFNVSSLDALGSLSQSILQLDGVIARARAAGAQYSQRELPFEAGPGAARRNVDVTVTPFEPAGRGLRFLIPVAHCTTISLCLGQLRFSG